MERVLVYLANTKDQCGTLLINKKAEYKYSFDYQNWYPSVEFETKNTTTNVGLYELSPFSKFEIKGELAHSELQRICTANIKNEKGRSTYTQMLNEGRRN